MNNYDDTFVEELVVRRNSLKNLLIEALVVVAAIALALACLAVFEPYFSGDAGDFGICCLSWHQVSGR